eukprot:TRINITY_DN3190_c0_g1_i1.p1 TRINITY_DN3190_c0_g1~~TRINITY_DN3190_c0_g1_i1.p1  ORF type:complete len:53 (-),score=38.24 TRINITY_DN3190_c0_g1_i1:2-160(-)
MSPDVFACRGHCCTLANVLFLFFVGNPPFEQVTPPRVKPLPAYSALIPLLRV